MGVKKAVVLTHRAVLSQIWELASALDCGLLDVIVSWLPLYHDMGYLRAPAAPAYAVSAPSNLSPFEWVRRPETLLEQHTEEQATLCWHPNFAFSLSATRIQDSARSADPLPGKQSRDQRSELSLPKR